MRYSMADRKETFSNKTNLGQSNFCVRNYPEKLGLQILISYLTVLFICILYLLKILSHKEYKTCKHKQKNSSVENQDYSKEDRMSNVEKQIQASMDDIKVLSEKMNEIETKLVTMSQELDSEQERFRRWDELAEIYNVKAKRRYPENIISPIGEISKHASDSAILLKPQESAMQDSRQKIANLYGKAEIIGKIQKKVNQSEDSLHMINNKVKCNKSTDELFSSPLPFYLSNVKFGNPRLTRKKRNPENEIIVDPKCTSIKHSQ